MPLVTKNQEPQQTSYSFKTVPQTLEEMEKLLVLLVLIAGCNLQAQELSGKVVVFPKRSYTDYVTLKPEKTDGGLKAMTVCLRYISDDKYGQTLFSMATSGHHNTPLLYKYADSLTVIIIIKADAPKNHSSSFRVAEQNLPKHGLEKRQNPHFFKTVPQTLGEMEKLLVLLVLIAGCYSQGQDLHFKMFTFPKKSASDYVILKPTNAEGHLKAMTICLRFGIGDHSEQALFSMATSAHHNTPLLFKRGNRYEVYMRVTENPLLFYGLPNELNKWHSYCFTWDSVTGLVQLWVDGVGSTKQMAHKSGSVEGSPSIILGQDQDKVGGGFDESESFAGHIRGVHVWDYVISDCEIQHYTSGSGFKHGNVINWKNLNYESYGDVVIEKMSGCHPSLD
ncbi:hypothetical protein AGOR_G00100280 [Albula goreensis]|uniref:Pentraxin (PTX) domain-containing protein n=1 Tax=Albula goreensis TaxID=1534307 RepID=A0A8T3DLH7_9TELE|nr:hypothetical protein AGOR_G00100280 [Albula goreensis]